MTTKPSPTKRQPSTSSVPAVKPQCKIHSLATVADKAQITGSKVVEIGENAFIHPHARIKAEHGNVIIGKGSIISEKAVVGVAEGSEEADVVVGEFVSIESGALVEARKIGDHTTIEVNAKIGRGAVVGKWCKIAPLCEVREKEVLEDYTVVFGNGQKRTDVVLKEGKDVRDMKARGRDKEVELLKTLIPDASIKWSGG